MPTIFPTSPHFDDFDETKQFVRILFRPGRAVQARELTQLQTIIQSQVERFGKGIYEDGSFISPPETTFDNVYSYVKLTEATGGTTSDDVIASLVGTEISNADGVRALIVNHALSTNDGDPPTIFVKYLDGGANKAEKFSDGDTLTSGSTTLTTLSSDSCGNGSAFSVGDTVIFAKGNFLFVNQQTHIIEKYTSPGDKLIGFNVTESVVDSDDDTSLLDPATGTFNFFAPGADRYKANLSLTSRALEFTSDTEPNFVEIARIQNNEIISLDEDPQFSVLGDAIARRTFDESGNYVVEPFEIELFEHLRTTGLENSETEARVTIDGIFPAANGGDNSLFVAKVTSGRAYVRGYEVDNLKTSYLTMSKARDNTEFISSVVPTSLSSFVKITAANSIPDFSSIVTLDLRDEFKSSNAGFNGSIIGSAKARGLIYLTGNVAAPQGGSEGRTAEFQLHVFDINMNPGEDFERNVKQISSTNSYTNFTANIVPVTTQLSGGITFNNASTTVLGSGTRFQTELKAGDVITHSNATFTHRLVVSAITDDVTLTTVNTPLGNVENTFAPYSINEALINDADKDSLLFKLPNDNIKEVDDTNISYSVKRQFVGETLSSGATTLGPLSAGENFGPFSTDNYVAVITSGVRAGELINIQSSQVTRDTVNRTIEFDFSSDGLSSEVVTIYTTVTKGVGAASRLKTKTLTTNQTIDITDKETAQKAVISLGKADGFKLNSVRMANVSIPFGGTFNNDDASNITARYSFDTGQKASFYDVAKIKLKPGQAKPTHPIRINFDFFTHSNDGDYFDVTSYAGLDYKNIPSVQLGQETFNLRDCIDFRPRLNDAGDGFTGTGAPTNQPLFLDPEVDFTLSFRHFLPKISSIGIDSNGQLLVLEGTSALNPVEPDFPGDSLKLFVLDQNAFVFNVIDDIKVKVIPNKRFTMKDIGKIENRVKTLEYYTSLNLLERDAEQTQIQDALGFDRFKNGFIVDSFTGHGVGDSVDNPDYATSINYRKREASPLVRTQMLTLREPSGVEDDQRDANNYAKCNEVITLPFNDVLLMSNPFSSTTNNLNPFNIGLYQGLMFLDPPGQFFFEDERKPNREVEALGEFDTLSKQSIYKQDGQNVFGSINDIEQFNQGTLVDSEKLPSKLRSLNDLIGELSPTTTTVEVTGNEVVKNTGVKPLMRSVGIRFQVDGMRPNTLLHAFFDDLNVSNSCSFETKAEIAARANVAANANVTLMVELANTQIDSYDTQLQTDENGSIAGTFYYDKDQRGLETGKKLFRLTNSSTNDKKSEITFAEATFFSDGIVREIYKEVLRPPPPPPPDDDDDDDDGGGPPPPRKILFNDMKYLDLMYKVVCGPSRNVGPVGDGWRTIHPVMDLNLAYNSLLASQQQALETAMAEIAEGFMANGLSTPPYEDIGEPAKRGRKKGFLGLGGRHRGTPDTRFKTLLSVVVWAVKDAFPTETSEPGGKPQVRRDGVAKLISATREAIKSNKTSGFGP